jgi:hypothetical protein
MIHLQHYSLILLRNTVILFFIVSIILFLALGKSVFLSDAPQLMCFYSVAIAVEFLFLRSYWHTFTFDRSQRIIRIKKYIFYFLINDVEIPFEKASISHGTEIGRSGESGWALRLCVDNKLFPVMSSLFEKPIIKMKEQLQNFMTT